MKEKSKKKNGGWHSEAQKVESEQLQLQQSPPSLIKTVLNLTGCVLGLAGSVCYEVTAYWTKAAFKTFIAPNQENKQWKRKLETATCYEEWSAAASRLDSLTGNDQWKEEAASPDYDYELIQARLEQLKEARESKDLNAISFLLRSSISRNFGDIGNAELYNRTHTGTKKLIEEFHGELIALLEFMRDEMSESNRIELKGKMELFKGLRHTHGNTALMLSGGATLGSQHIGVLKALYETRLLPRIISGSSAGAIMASVLCTSADEEISRLLRLEGVNMNFYEESLPNHSDWWIISIFQQFFAKINRIFSKGVLFDSQVLQKCMRENLGDITFLEAFRKTRLVLNVTVSSSTLHEMPRLLNYLTAPNVLIWSAVVASCAIPGVYNSSPILAKDPSGAFVPWNLSEEKWIDGSVENDIPTKRLAELFNVNHFIVSQVNPHVYPFLSPNKTGSVRHRNWSSMLSEKILFLMHSEVCFRLAQMIKLGVFPKTAHRILSVLIQKYDGDITIVPALTWTDIQSLFADPSIDSVLNSIRRGERATWPAISIIWNQCKVELVLDQILTRLRDKARHLQMGGVRLGEELRRSGSPIVYRNLESSLSFDDEDGEEDLN